MLSVTVRDTYCTCQPPHHATLSCGRCAVPLCATCMVATSVGVRCRRCAGSEAPRFRRDAWWQYMPVTLVLIVLNAAVFVVGLWQSGLDTSRGPVGDAGVLYGPLVAAGEWWRLLTSAFVHAGPVHLLLNMALLAFLGYLLEPALGSVRFAGVYLSAVLASAAAVVLFAPLAPTVGASGGVFGLMAAGIIWEQARGGDALRSPLTTLLLVNVAFSFLVPNVSLAGHIGGALGGAIAGLLVADRWLPRMARTPVGQAVLLVGFMLLCVLAALWGAPHDLHVAYNPGV